MGGSRLGSGLMYQLTKEIISPGKILYRWGEGVVL